MFVEFTLYQPDPKLIVVNAESISVAMETIYGTHITVNGYGYDLKEPFEEVKKRLGLRIAPRGETLAI